MYPSCSSHVQPESPALREGVKEPEAGTRRPSGDSSLSLPITATLEDSVNS